MKFFAKRYKPAYKSKDKIPKKYFKGLNKIERRMMAEEILKRPQSLKYWSADKAYSSRLKNENKNLPKSKYTLAFEKKYGKENGKTLEKISKITGIKLSILKEVHKRGIGAWQGSHKPGVFPNQWAKARVFSFVMGGKTRKTADRDLWLQHLDNKKRKNPVDRNIDLDTLFSILPNIKIISSGSELLSGKPVYKFTLNNSKEILGRKLFPGSYVLKYYGVGSQVHSIDTLITLSRYKLIPKIYIITNKFIIMKYINAINFENFAVTASRSELEIIFNNIEQAIRLWHRLGFFHGDIGPNGNNIMIDKETLDIYLIDPVIDDYEIKHMKKQTLHDYFESDLTRLALLKERYGF